MTNQTVEQKMYGPGWHTCARCGLTGPDVKVHGEGGVITLCSDPTRCSKVTAGETLGGPIWPGRPSPVPVLNDADHARIDEVVQQHLREREAAAGPVSVQELLDADPEIR